MIEESKKEKKARELANNILEKHGISLEMFPSISLGLQVLIYAYFENLFGKDMIVNHLTQLSNEMVSIGNLNLPKQLAAFHNMVMEFHERLENFNMEQ